MQVATFQQGVNGYTDTTSVWLQASNTSTDANTIANPAFEMCSYRTSIVNPEWK